MMITLRFQLNLKADCDIEECHATLPEEPEKVGRIQIFTQN